MTMKWVELAALCQKHKPNPKDEVSELAAKHGMKIFFLPVAHPALNLIELVWSQLKDYVKKKNVNYSLADCEKFAEEFLDTFDVSKWKSCIDHVKKIEEKDFKVADEIPFQM